ncbi:hypothetical protein [Georgenia yuyongxinii]|uniref:Uncharacterized protein n=1 Tax=Georgenia yuyongxinii TaxID=2589797 RepID=A0A552WUA4_9MICO|nr:hypothetical protein [Georgenia yuyongxinii]TRW46428.1 hypothetical protein FJ693_05740 [Georgenia yuyongxinii]
MEEHPTSTPATLQDLFAESQERMRRWAQNFREEADRDRALVALAVPENLLRKPLTRLKRDELVAVVEDAEERWGTFGAPLGRLLHSMLHSAAQDGAIKTNPLDDHDDVPADQT